MREFNYSIWVALRRRKLDPLIPKAKTIQFHYFKHATAFNSGGVGDVRDSIISGDHCNFCTSKHTLMM